MKNGRLTGLFVTLTMLLMLVLAMGVSADAATHTHDFTNGGCSCGASSACDSGHTGWTALTQDSIQHADYKKKELYKIPAGNYYLDGDITLDMELCFLGAVNFCLNGHSLDCNGCRISVGLGYDDWSVLNFYDCSGTGCVCSSKTYSNAVFWIGYKNNGSGIPTTMNLYGGSLQGFTLASGSSNYFNSAVVALGQNYNGYSVFNMYGGSIKNITNGRVVSTDGNFNMYGGSISNLTSATAVYSYGTHESNMYGGSISNASRGVYGPNFHMYGGSIKDCETGAYLTGSSINNNKGSYLFGGEITQNTNGVTTTNQNLVTITVGGSIKITDNTNYDVKLDYENAYILFDSTDHPPAADMCIGCTKSANNKISYYASPDYSKYFFANDQYKRIAYHTDDQKLYLESVPVIEDTTGTVSGDTTAVEGMKTAFASVKATNVRDTAVTNTSYPAVQLQAKLKSVTGDNSTVTKAVYEITPIDKMNREVETPCTVPITFRLPVSSADADYVYAQIFKDGEAISALPITTSSTYVEVSVDNFTGGEYSYELTKVNIGATSGTTYDASLSLYENIKMNLFITPNNDADISKFSVKATFNGTTKSFNNLALNDSGNTACKIPGIAEIYSYQMTQPVAIRVFYDGVICWSRNFSVRDYCDTAATAHSSDAELMALCHAALDYGTAAQNNFRGKSYYIGQSSFTKAYDVGTTLANAGFTAGTYEVQSKPTPDANAGSASTIPNFSDFKSSLVFASELSMKYYFTFSGNISDYTFKAQYKTNGGSWQDLSAQSRWKMTEPVVNPNDQTTYSLKITNLTPYDLDTLFRVIIYDKAATPNVVAAVRYSPWDYVSENWNGGDEKLSNACKALINYWKAAKVYSEPK